MSDKLNVFSQTPHLSREQMSRYIGHRLIGKELHKVEKHLVDCSLCNEALEGMKKIKKIKEESRILTITDELHKLARKRKLVRRKVFRQFDMINWLAIIFLIIFLIVIAIVFFVKK
jgi:hypothetical protein